MSRREIDEWWESKETPLIIAGDFNTGHETEEIRRREGYLVARNTTEASPSQQMHYGRESPSLLIANPPESIEGTIFVQNRGWIWCDLIVVSSSLLPKIKVRAHILRKIENEELASEPKGRPRQKYGDHFPVEAEIAL